MYDQKKERNFHLSHKHTSWKDTEQIFLKNYLKNSVFLKSKKVSFIFFKVIKHYLWSYFDQI